jgi:hypothetical protein
VLDEFGNAQATGPAAQGLFFEDTRYLAQLLLTIDGVRPLLLSSSVAEDNGALTADLTNPDLCPEDGPAMAKDTIHILSTTMLGDDALFQSLAFRNFGHEEARFQLALDFAPTSSTSSKCAARRARSMAICCPTSDGRRYRAGLSRARWHHPPHLPHVRSGRRRCRRRAARSGR